MKQKNNPNFILNATLVLTKVFELLHWFGAFSMLALAIATFAARPWLQSTLDGLAPDFGPELSSYGFEMTVIGSNGQVSMTAILLFALAALMIFSFMAMVFRNIYLITRKSKDSTPFQPDNIRMLKEIGIFAISVPVVGLAMSIIARLVLGVDAVETSVNLYGFSMGLIVLCLTQFFIHGAELEKDVDGLL